MRYRRVRFLDTFAVVVVHVAGLIFCLGIVGTSVWVVAHFIHKFW